MRRAVTLATIAVVIGLSGSLPGAASGHGATPSSAHTHRVVVRPVDAHGQAAPGWKVHRQRHGSVQCDGASRGAVDDGITECFPTAEYLPACWRSQHHTVLCLRDARTRQLVRVRYTGAFGAPVAPVHPTPQDLDLAGGQQCAVRFGGAWGTLPTHRQWLGFYSCEHGSVYGPASGDGIDRARALWSVREWRSSTRDSLATHRVRTAYYVGTHS